MNKTIYSIFQGSSTNLLDDILGFLGYINLAGWMIPIMGLIILGVCITIIIIIYKIIFRMINKRITLQGSTPEVYNGLKFITRFIIGIIIIILIMDFLKIDSSYLLIISGIIISAIAFASMNAITNFISGIWILLVRPFTVGDYIDVNGVDGLVTEISLNYTRLKHVDETISLIPNSNCINTSIINHTITKKWLEQHAKRLNQTKQIAETILDEGDKDIFKIIRDVDEELNLIQDILRSMNITEKNYFIKSKNNKNEKKKYSTYVQKNKMVRYVLELNLDKRVKRNDKLLEEVCKKWSEFFLFKPFWKLEGADFYAYYRFILITPDPELIIKYLGRFIEDIYKAIYTET